MKTASRAWQPARRRQRTINDVAPDGELAARVATLAASLAKGATGAYGEAKRLIRAAWNETLETQIIGG